MRISIVIPDLQYRGGERYLISLANGLQNFGHSVTVVVGRAGYNPRSFEKEISISYPRSNINVLFRNDLIFIFLSPIFILLRLWKFSHKTDLIYTTDHFSALLPAVLVGKLLRKKVVVTFFGVLEKPTNFFLNSLVTFSLSILIRVATSYCALAIVHDDRSKEIIKKYYHAKDVRTLFLGVSNDNFAIKGRTIKDSVWRDKLKGKHVLIVVGSINPLRRQDMAIKVLSEVKKTLPRTALVFVGDGKQSYIQRLIAMAKSHKLENDSFFTGTVSEEKLKFFYNIADVVVHTSYIIGYTVLEAAMLRTMPVYLSFAKPYGHLYEKRRIGIVIKQDDPKLFAKKIVSYLKNKSKYKERKKETRMRVMKEFSEEQFIQKTERILRYIVRNSTLV